MAKSSWRALAFFWHQLQLLCIVAFWHHSYLVTQKGLDQKKERGDQSLQSCRGERTSWSLPLTTKGARKRQAERGNKEICWREIWYLFLWTELCGLSFTKNMLHSYLHVSENLHLFSCRLLVNILQYGGVLFMIPLVFRLSWLEYVLTCWWTNTYEAVIVVFIYSFYI